MGPCYQTGATGAPILHGAMDPSTKAKIDALLRELRSWFPNEPPRASVYDLAGRFDLDPLIVKRIGESEGWKLKNGNQKQVADPLADTQPIPVEDSEK